MIPTRTSILAGIALMTLTSLCHGRSLNVRIDSLIALGMDTTRSFDGRVLSFKEAVKLDRSGQAMYRLASLYVKGGKANDRGDAEFWFKGAIARDRQNTTYRCAYAKLLWDLDDLGGANRQAEKVLDVNPDHLCGLYYAGKYAAWGMDRNLNAASIAKSGDVVVPFSLSEFGEDRMSRAIQGVDRYYALGSDRLSMSLGVYSLIGETEDATSRAIGSFRDLLDVRSFGDEDLEISTLLLARRIVEQEGETGRDRFIILPNPM